MIASLFSHYELVMNFCWGPKDSHNRYELYKAWWNQTQPVLKTPPPPSVEILTKLNFKKTTTPLFSYKISQCSIFHILLFTEKKSKNNVYLWHKMFGRANMFTKQKTNISPLQFPQCFVESLSFSLLHSFN